MEIKKDRIIQKGMEQAKTESELIVALKELTLLNEENEKRIAALISSNNELNFQSKKKESEQEKIKESEAKFRALFENSIDGILLTITDGTILAANPAACEIFRMTAEEICNAGRISLVDTSDPRAEMLIRERQLTGKAKGELTFMRKDGTTFPGEITSVVFKDFHGEERTSMIIRDTTERKQAEFQLEQTRIAFIKTLEEKNQILESVGDAFFAVDKDWIVTYWNKQAEKMLEKKKNEIIGKNLWEVFTGSTESLSYKKYREATENNTVVHFEDYYPPLNKWYEISAYPLEGGLSVYFKDVSERKLSDLRVRELNESLQRQTDKLIVSNEELERFAYVASHDLQEPLRMVTSFLQLLQKKYDNQLDEAAQKYINFAVDGAERMKILILDLLEFSRISAFIEDHTTISLNEIISKTLMDLKISIDESAAIINVASLPKVCGNRSQLLQLFINIIGNAIKYKSHSSPVINIGYTDLPGEWQFYVQDNGIGIDEKFYEKIFIIFQRLHNQKEYKGTGIGLAICKKIVELHGGRIWVESIKDHGSTFYFTIRKLQLSNEDDAHVLCEDIDECLK